MKEHKGMRPQDVYILLKIAVIRHKKWFNKDLAQNLAISNSEISESLNRSMQAQLIDDEKRNIYRRNLLEFLIHGLKYVFPVVPGNIARGIPTAHSAPPLDLQIRSNENYIWPHIDGDMRGLIVKPLYKTIPKVVSNDQKLYQLLALTDAIRIGRSRERNLAIDELEKKIIDDEW